VTEVEVRKLFLLIQNAYNSFAWDDVKVKIWAEMLADTPFDLAMTNLRQHIMSEPYPPTIADIRRGGSEEKSNVPGVEETRQWLREVDRMRERAVPMPEHVRKELRRIVRGRA